MKKNSVLLVFCLLVSVFALPAFAVTRGDVNRDGNIMADDARLALRRSVSLEDYMPGSARFIAADMDGDGAVTASDARAVLRLSVGLPTEIPEETPADKEPDAAFVAAAQRFSVELFKAGTAGETENVLLSPLSVLTALAMTANGTAGETMKGLENALGGLPVSELNAYLRTFCAGLPDNETNRLHIANSIWVNESVRSLVRPSFLSSNIAYYDAGINACLFDDDAVRAINNWVRENTDDMIDGILDRADPDILMLLMNALAFDAKWQRPYSENQIGQWRFTDENGAQALCDMMYGEESVYLENANAAGFVKPYRNGDYRFVALLPNEGVSAADLAASLTPASLSALFKNARTDLRVHTGLPTFRFSYQTSLVNALQQMGAGLLFSSGACDFGNMFSQSVGAYVSDVIHKTFIEVNGAGTRAAAVTGVIVEKNAVLFYDKTVILDRPFVFMILPGDTDIPLFIGILRNPNG